MQTIISDFLAGGENRSKRFREIVAALKPMIATTPAQAAGILRRVILPDLDYSSAEACTRLLKQIRVQLPRVRPKKLAILGTFTTHQLAALIELYLFALGIDVEIYESDYGVMQQEIFDPTSGLHAFRPDLLFLAVDRRSMGARPAGNESPEHVAERVAAEVSTWSTLWQAAHTQLGCQVIQNNFDPPAWRALHNHEMRHHATAGRFISSVNHALIQQAPPYVTIHDVEHLSAAAGRWAWGDQRFYYHAKLPCAPEFLAGYAHSVASLIAAHSGHAKKCLVLDLDNTLWGGVIGDDGLGGIRLGQGEAEGEAFQAFQHYVHDLHRRGVILAVCSKNNESVAREVFEKHTEMVLRSDDIACFVANWEDKASNLRRIAKTLEIGIDSLVFVDDNPAEREIVRQMVPEVAVPELPEDPAGYIHAIERYAYFQAVSVGTEDFGRGEMYRANAQRQQAEVVAGNIDAFLQSLQMKARVEPVSQANLERVVQLIGRSNQFNLTTRRHSTSAVSHMAESPDHLTFTISLADRFGDNGLISVILARVVERELQIDTWLMSCRVLKRGVEAFVRNLLVHRARERGLVAIVGSYIPTAKNALVKEHYAGLGFQLTKQGDDGQTEWRLNVSDATDTPNFIEKV